MRYRVGYSKQATNEGYLTNYSGQDTEGGRRDDSYVEGQLEFDIGERPGFMDPRWQLELGCAGGRSGRAYGCGFALPLQHALLQLDRRAWPERVGRGLNDPFA